MERTRPCRLLFAAAGALLLGAIALDSATAQTVDQQNTLYDSYIGPGDGPGQSFTPTQSTIAFATFSLAVSDPSPELVYVDVYRGAGFGGALIGISNSVLINSGSFGSYPFTFSTAITLVPGQVYTLGLNNGFGDLFALEESGNPYAGGVEYDSNDVAQPDYDLTFSEGGNAAPEPSTWAVLGGGGLWALALFRRKGKA